ncbi:serine/threonine protein kinase [Lotmaria passim]
MTEKDMWLGKADDSESTLIGSSIFDDDRRDQRHLQQPQPCHRTQLVLEESGGSVEEANHSSIHGRSFLRSELRIELPHSGSSPRTSLTSPADATATTNESPRTAVYRNPDGTAFQREMEGCTPTSIAEHHARQSAIALLHADITNKAHLAASVSRRGGNPAESVRQPPSLLLYPHQHQPSLYPATSGSFEMAEESASQPPHAQPASPQHKKKPSLQQFLTTRIRKNRSALSSLSGLFMASSSSHQREISIALDLTSGADQESRQLSPPAHSSTIPQADNGTSEPQVAVPQLSSSRLATSLASVERLPRSMSVSSPSPPVVPLAQGSTATPPPLCATDDDAEDSSSSSGQNIGMEAVLRDASRIRGIRLTWMFYLLIVMVIILFVLLLVQIIYESNRTLVRTATQAVRAQASVLFNSVDFNNYALMNVFMLLHEVSASSFRPMDAMYDIMRDNFCFRFYGSPMAFALYNGTGDLVWKIRCSLYPVSQGYQEVPLKIMPGPSEVRTSDYTWDAALAQRSFYNAVNDSVETFVMLIDKETLGRTLLGNRFPQYSSSTLQYVTSAFLTRMWNGSKPRILFHTLTKTRPTYVATENGTVHDSLTALFHDICYEGSPYIWHTVTTHPAENAASSARGDSNTDHDRPSTSARWPPTTMSEIPSPHLEYGRSWGQLSVANLCGVQCFGAAGDTRCDFNNPTNTWFVVEYSLTKQNGLSSILNVVGVVSIVALVIFSFVMFLVYISITVPVNFLRVQLLKAVGANDTQTDFQRKVVSWTYRLWLGDLTAIVRSTHILSLCFQLNKKYVPDHVLRNHAQQLYLRRRKFNFLEDVDLKDDPADHGDTESESDLEPTLAAQLPDVSPVMPSTDTRFLWRFAAGMNDGDGDGDGDDGARQSTDAEPTTLLEAQGGGGGGGALPPLMTATAAASSADHPPTGEPRASAQARDLSAVMKRSKSVKRTQTCASDPAMGPWPIGELESGPPLGNEVDVSLAMSALNNVRSMNTMAIRRESESTILCVRIPNVELAYLLNYSVAAIQHRRIMRILLHRIRRHKGALFHRSGDCLAAVWNAFEGCPNHAETAAICAQEIANAFAPFRMDGLHIGLVLHQGVLVCGTIEYSKAAFVTAFGDGPREAYALSDLAATVGSLNILVTEPVKQSLSGLYDCNIVDVVQLPNSAHPLLLFELGGSRGYYATPAAPERRAQFAVEYARAFAQFRNHEFTEALHGIEQIRLHLSNPQNEHLLRRLERLCVFYATAPSSLPFPYVRPFPVWANYEVIAQAGLLNDVHFRPPRSSSFLSCSFMNAVVYNGVPTVRDDVEYIEDFKQELQENMRRTARKGNGSPTLDESSTRPHITPRSSPPMCPTADPTMSERVISVGSAMEMSDNIASTASPWSKRVDVANWKTTATRTSTMELLTLLPASVTAKPSLSANMSNFPSVALLTFDALPVSASEPMADSLAECCCGGDGGSGGEDACVSAAAAAAAAAATASGAVGHSHASVAGSSIQSMDSPRDVFAMSNRFAVTHRVTNRPPVALAAGSPELPDLTAERYTGETLTRHSSSEGHHDNASNSIIQSAAMSFKNSVNNMLHQNGGVGANGYGGGGDAGGGNMHSFSVSGNELPTEIKAKSGTTYLRSTRILGKGSFGCVYLGMDAHSGRLVAIKFLPMPSDESGMKEIEAEVLILQRVNDTHVVQLLSYAFEGDTIVIIMECMLAGSLQNMISAFGSIPSSTARVFMRDVLRGLSKIHSMGVIHRDMKPQNVLLSLAGNCKISDFGASAWLQELARKESQGRVCGTPVYLAPEAARGSPAKESDIWSCGIMFLQMITGTLPYPPEQLSAGAAVLVFQIGSGIAVPRIPDTLDELDAEFVRACLQVEPSKRLTASALLQLPIFTV